MTAKDQILGVILAGGAARRMGGGDKGLAQLAGLPMVAHVMARLRPQVDHLILNANGPPARFAGFDVPVVADRTELGRGPLEGIHAAMCHAVEHLPQVTRVVTVATDVPFLPLDLVARLNTALIGGGAIASSGGRRHPVVALWPLQVRHGVADALDRGQFSLNAFAERHGAVEVDFAFEQSGALTVDPLFNANTPEDIATAHGLAVAAAGRLHIHSQKS